MRKAVVKIIEHLEAAQPHVGTQVRTIFDQADAARDMLLDQDHALL